MRTAIVNGTLLTPYERRHGEALFVEAGKIQYIGNHPPPSDEIIEAKGLWVVPGFIDLHVHGSVGHDVMDVTQDALYGMARFFVQHGVTAYYPTTMASATNDIKRVLALVASVPMPSDGAQHLGVHLEGPYLSPLYCGAQPIQFLREPNPDEYLPWLISGIVRLVTLAPELPQAEAFIETLIEHQIQIAIGHTDATYDQAQRAFDKGVRQCTHTYNAMRGLHHREPGALGAVLCDERIYAQIIPDGIHVHPKVVQLLAMLKGPARTIIITDATSAAGLPNGNYSLGTVEVIVEAGVARTRDGALAGSTLTMAQALKNMMSFCGLSLQDVLPMATQTPAQAMELPYKGRLAVGCDADIVLLDTNLNVCLTMVGGRVVYNAR